MILKPVLLCLLLVAILVAPSFGQTVRVRLDDREYDVDLNFRAVGGPVAPPGNVGPLTLSRRAEADRDSIAITWPQAEHAARYVIHRRTNLGEWSRLTTISATSAALPGGMAGYVDRDLDPNLTYTYLVRAMNDLDVSEWSPIGISPPREQVSPLPAAGDRPFVADVQTEAGVSVAGKEVAVGDTLRLLGGGFGEELGTVRMYGVLVPVIRWSDTEILFRVPANTTSSTRPITLTITRTTARYYTGALFTLKTLKNGP